MLRQRLVVFGICFVAGGCMFSLEDIVAEPSDGSGGVDASVAAPDASIDVSGEEGCEPGETRPCYSGNAFEVGVGVCQAGTRTCGPSGWGSCQGDVGPSIETCNGLDDDCDGAMDEGCDCTTGETRPCYAGPSNTQDRGVCHAGVQSCVAGKWGASCEGQVLPTTEDCRGSEDMDCDGKAGCKDGDCEGATCDDRRICRSGVCLWEGIGCGACPWDYDVQGGACYDKYACFLEGRAGRHYSDKYERWEDGCAICNMGATDILWQIY